jgi:hypothetical protein
MSTAMCNTVAKDQVTDEMIDACWRLIDITTNEPYYSVASRSEYGKNYEVRAIKRGNKWYLTCTCPTGQEGGKCWHKRAAKAAAIRDREEVRVRIIDRIEVNGVTFWTVQEGRLHAIVAEYHGYRGHPLHCSCDEFRRHVETLQLPLDCRHVSVVRDELARIAKELQLYNRETLTA